MSNASWQHSQRLNGIVIWEGRIVAGWAVAKSDKTAGELKDVRIGVVEARVKL